MRTALLPSPSSPSPVDLIFLLFLCEDPTLDCRDFALYRSFFGSGIVTTLQPAALGFYGLWTGLG